MTSFALLLQLLLLAAAPAAAGELTHRVAPNETLGDIAQTYYGDAGRADVIRFYNGLASSVIQAGSELRVPVVDEHSVVAGDSWSALALRYWGDASLHRRLAEQSAGSADARLRVGEKLRIGVLLSYPLGSGDTLAAVSRRFYGHPGRAVALARFNRVKDPRRLRAGFKVRVPLTDLGPPPELAAPPAPEPATPEVASPPPEPESPRLEKPLRRAINTYLDGRYAQALEELEELRPQVLANGSRAEQVLLLQHLIFVYTAFEQVDAACDSYRALRQVDPELHWDRDLISPKILRLVASCEGG